MVYAMNQNGWVALIICKEKNLKSCNLQKLAFLANTQHQCFACCSKRIHQLPHYFGSLHRMFVTPSA